MSNTSVTSLILTPVPVQEEKPNETQTLSLMGEGGTFVTASLTVTTNKT